MNTDSLFIARHIIFKIHLKLHNQISYDGRLIIHLYLSPIDCIYNKSLIIM